MATETRAHPDGSPDPEVISTRVIKAPREAVFRAFTDPEILSKWWGPNGHSNTFHEFDPRPGGTWRFVMHGPDGTDYQMVKRFVDVIPHERIVLQHIDPTHGFRMLMTFADADGATQLTWHMRFESAEEAERVREFVLAANEQNLDRLETQLRARA